MTVSRTKDNRVVLQRARKSKILRLLGIAGVAMLLIPAASYLAAGYERGDLFWAALGFFIAVLVIPFGFVLFDECFLKVILSETHISFQRWRGTPYVYTYTDISDIENVVVDVDQHHFRASHVKLTFADGRAFKIGNSLVSAKEFRKLLREKSGRTFRKKRRAGRRWWWWK